MNTVIALSCLTGVDDTRMDLSQFDDAAGRSVPTTPRSRTPPTISITEAPPLEADDDTVVATSDRAAAWGDAGDGGDQPPSEASDDKTPQAEGSKDSENLTEVVEGETGEETRPEGRGDTPTPSTSQEGMASLCSTDDIYVGPRQCCIIRRGIIIL